MAGVGAAVAVVVAAVVLPDSDDWSSTIDAVDGRFCWWF